MPYNLTEKAMLIRVTITGWSGRKYDAKVSAQVAHDHGARGDAGNFNKILVAKSALADIVRIANETRQFFYDNTSPWGDDDYRILPSKNYLTVVEGLRDRRSKHEEAARIFCDAYPDLKDDARIGLNGLFRESDYPHVSVIRSKFRFDFSVMPLPDAKDFRVDMSDDEVVRIQADIESRVNKGIENALTDLWQRIHNTVSHMSERLKAYSVDDKGKVSNPFRDSLVGNLRDLVDLLPRLNVTENAELADMTERLSSLLCPYEPETLRNSDELRESVSRDADAILADMAGYVS